MLPPLGVPGISIPFNNANSNTPNFIIAGSTGKLKSTTAEKKFQDISEKLVEILSRQETQSFSCLLSIFCCDKGLALLMFTEMSFILLKSSHSDRLFRLSIQ
jgi:hypothetical protein